MMIRLFLLISFITAGLISKAAYITEGYMSKTSYAQGDTAVAFISANSTYSNVKLYLRNVNSVIVDSIEVSISPQSITTNSPSVNGYGFSPSFTYVIPTTLKSGLYNWENKVFFIVKRATKDADFTLVYPSNTEAAYNPAGGYSLYSNPNPHVVSFLRPIDPWAISQVLPVSLGILQWLETIGTYDYQLISDRDLDDYSEIQNSDVLVIIGHSEYWTRPARLNFDQFVDGGKNIAVLSGNTMWWQVRYDTVQNRLICYKDLLLDTIQNPLLKTYKWTDTSLHYPVINSIGVDWPHGCYPPSGATYFGYKILLPNSPLLAGSGLGLYSTLSCASRECDATLYYGFDSLGYPIIDTTSLGFCKIELLGFDKGAGSINTSLPGNASFVAFQKTPTSGKIVNVGFMDWCSNPISGYLGGFGGPDAPKIKIITANILDLLLADSSIFSSPPIECYTLGNAAFDKPELRVIPNPSTGIFSVQVPEEYAGVSIIIRNDLGQTLFTTTSEKTFDLSAMPQGLYFVSIVTPNGILSQKIVLQH